MKLSTRSRYATRALLDLAIYYGKEPIALKDIAQRQEISEQYLQQLIGPLKVIGMIKSIRGANGGFMLVKPPSQIRISHIIKAVEGSIAFVDCVDDSHACPRANKCPTRGIWVKATKAAGDVFDSISLQDLIDQAGGDKLPSGSIM
ncbi:MAG: Rrf2 family transcriptional regulator [Chloroflexota bacterium]